MKLRGTSAHGVSHTADDTSNIHSGNIYSTRIRTPGNLSGTVQRNSTDFHFSRRILDCNFSSILAIDNLSIVGTANGGSIRTIPFKCNIDSTLAIADFSAIVKNQHARPPVVGIGNSLTGNLQIHNFSVLADMQKQRFNASVRNGMIMTIKLTIPLTCVAISLFVIGTWQIRRRINIRHKMNAFLSIYRCLPG